MMEASHESFSCRSNCGACCIVPSISSPIPGMPGGKPAGVRCIHLNNDHTCAIFLLETRPRVCDGFKAEALICGNSRQEAISILALLEGIEPDKQDF
jgi:uncharacterized protein